jgi:hypothetical protein
MERAFRYQTGERDEILKELRIQGMVEVDVDSEGEIRPFLKDLESYGIYEVFDIPWDYEAISFFKEQDFLCRIYVEDRMAESCISQLFIDFYKEYTEASYDEIFWG